MPTSVVKKYSSRWLPVRSCTYTQRTATSPSPDWYHRPVPLTIRTSRRPPPYQATFSAVRLAPVTTCSGVGNLLPLTRGRQCPQPARPRDANRYGQDDPLVPPAERGGGVRGADRVAVAALAEDLRASVLVDGVITGQEGAVLRDEVVEDPSGQAARQPPRG